MTTICGVDVGEPALTVWPVATSIEPTVPLMVLVRLAWPTLRCAAARAASATSTFAWSRAMSSGVTVRALPPVADDPPADADELPDVDPPDPAVEVDVDGRVVDVVLGRVVDVDGRVVDVVVGRVVGVVVGVPP